MGRFNCRGPVGTHSPTGLPVWTVQHRNVPMVSMLLLVRTGGCEDPVGAEGLAALTADALDDGAGGRDSFALHDAIAGLGASLEIECGTEATALDVTTLEATFRDAAHLLADVAYRPTFDAHEVERVRDLRRQRVAQMKDVPSAIAERVFVERLFEGHPYGHLAMGSDTSLASLEAEDVRAFHASHYGVDRCLAVVVGEVSHDEMRDAIEAAFGAMGQAPRVVTRADVTGAPAIDVSGTLFLVDRPGAPQSEIRVGRLAPPRATSDYFPLLVMNAALGGQFVSRINLNLREDKGYTYGVRSGFDFRIGPGAFVVQTSVQTDATAASVREVLRECDDIGTSRPLDHRELALAHAGLTRGYPRSFETGGQIARSCMQAALYGLPDDYFDTFVERVCAVDIEAVTRTAARWVAARDLFAVVVGDRSRIEAGLRDVMPRVVVLGG